MSAPRTNSFDERAFIERVEAADADELAEILRRPSPEEDRALRAYLGETRYQRQRDLTLRRSIRRSATREPAGNVVVIHGIMGSELSSFTRTGAAEQIWVKVFRIVAGTLDRLQLADDGLKELDESFDVRPTGILKRHYGELLLSLATTWRVRAFWFDWRKSLDAAAAELETKIRGWFEEGEPIHVVAHSMGGLVARTLIVNHPDRWKAMRGSDGSGGRLVMLGTPNHGSFVIPQVIAGIESMVKKITLLDLRHSTRELQRVFNSFPGLYQMLPSPLVQSGRWAALYDRDTYGAVAVSRRHLEAASEHHKLLSRVVDPERLVYVAGANQATFDGVDELLRLGELGAYNVTLDGDGRVPHSLGLLDGVPTYYVEENHGDLSANAAVLGQLDELLRTGECTLLTSPPKHRAAAADGKVRGDVIAAQEREEQLVRELASALGSRSAGAEMPRAAGGSTERELEQLVVHGFLSTAEVDRPPTVRQRQPGQWTIRIALLHSRIEDVGDGDGDAPIDALAVGHYVGVKPQEAELELDKAISAALASARGSRSRERLILTEYTERGIIRGELGQPFFLDDPRVPAGRLIVLAGMGLPGRFGAPELTVLARELAWSLGRLGKRHLATVLIGGGTGNIATADAVDAWLLGVCDALTGSVDDGAKLERLTFVEASASKLRVMQRAILSAASAAKTNGDALRIEYEPLEEHELVKLEQQDRAREIDEIQRRLQAGKNLDVSAPKPAPTRLTLSLDAGTYTFGAITHDAALPERAIPLDPNLVAEANDELAGEWRPDVQWERGQLLNRLLIPDDLRPHLATNAPIVMLLDSTTARIHWEMVAQSERRAPDAEAADGNQPDPSDLTRFFLGTSRGLTRQLRTTFAPPPEAPPPPRRVLRVLVVADPAADRPLSGAEEEGVAVADLFESFNDLVAPRAGSRVSVVRLFGPNAATRTAVLRELVAHSYDVLHYAGHCVYDNDDPARQGWLFTGDQLLSPNELNRIDRIPKFVFSNACESGVTPDRADRRNDALAPSFAESFFARGVANFVCTAWPVADGAARELAVTLYSRLLGIRPVKNRPGTYEVGDSWDPEEMHEAMRAARLRIFDTPDGRQTWGAYQHYGNPYFRLFEAPADGGRSAGVRAGRRKRAPSTAAR